MADDPTLSGLAADLTSVRKALDAMGKGAKDAGDETKKTGEKAAYAGRMIVGVMSEAAREALGFEEATKHASAGVNTFAGALGELAHNGIAAAVAGLEEFARNIPEAAARSEAHAETLARLGGAYAEVQRATNGAVSAEQAAAVQQRVLQSGLRLSGQELAAVTLRAREFARATGGDVNQALDQLADQLVNPGEELAKFGVRLQTGMAQGDALREALRQLGAQAQTMGASQVTLAESMEMASRAAREAGDALAGMIAQRLELRDFFVQLTSWIDDAKTTTDGWNTAVETIVGTLREMIGLRGQASAQQNQSASGAFTGEAGALMAQARGRGLNFGGLEIGRMGVDATPEQRARLITLLRRAALGQLTQQVLDVEVQGFDAEVDLTAQDRTRQAAAAAAATAAARRQEITRRNRAGQSASSTTAPDTTASWFRNQADQQGFTAWGEMFRRERERVAAERGGSVAQRLAGVDLQRQSSAAANELDIAGMSRGGILGGALSRSAGEAETRQRADRTRVIREQREALAQLLVEAQREEDIARRMGRPVAEVNGLIQQRIGIQTSLAQSTRDLVAAQEEQASGFSIVGEKLIGTLEGTADAFAESVVAALEGSKGFTEAVEEMVRGTLRALAKLAIVEALKEGAMAIAAAATYRYDAAVQHGIAAGMWAGVGVLAGAGVAAMGTPKPAGNAGASAPSSSGRSATADRQARADERGGGGPLVMNIVVNGALMTEDAVHHAVGVAVRGAAATGHLAPGLFGGS